MGLGLVWLVLTQLWTTHLVEHRMQTKSLAAVYETLESTTELLEIIQNHELLVKLDAFLTLLYTWSIMYISK